MADWHDVENNGASEVHVKSFKSKEGGMTKLEGTSTCLCADGSSRQEGNAQHQTLRHQRVKSFNVRGAPSTSGEARSEPLQCARV